MKLGFQHGEAFHLMRYASRDGRNQELLWNSRDGVTPFIIHSNDGIELQHVEWQKDVRIERYVPPIGMRVFVDLTEERAREFAQRWADQRWEGNDYGLNTYFSSKEEAIEHWVKEECLDRPGSPDVIVVDTAFQQELLARYAGTPEPIETRAPWDCYQLIYRTPDDRVKTAGSRKPHHRHQAARTPEGSS